MVRRQDIVYTEGCPSAHLLASTSQIIPEITDFTTLAERGDCCEALCVDKLNLRCAPEQNLKTKMCAVKVQPVEPKWYSKLVLPSCLSLPYKMTHISISDLTPQSSR